MTVRAPADFEQIQLLAQTSLPGDAVRSSHPRGLLETVSHPNAGDVRMVGIPVRLSETPGGIRLAPPLVGEHTTEILGELGYSAEQVSELRQSGVV